MGFALEIGPEDAHEEAYTIGSALDRTDFMEWVEGLPGEGFAELKAFAPTGAAGSGTRVAEQIGLALSEHPPDREGVERTATEFADILFDLPDGTPTRYVD